MERVGNFCSNYKKKEWKENGSEGILKWVGKKTANHFLLIWSECKPFPIDRKYLLWLKMKSWEKENFCHFVLIFRLAIQIFFILFCFSSFRRFSYLLLISHEGIYEKNDHTCGKFTEKISLTNSLIFPPTLKCACFIKWVASHGKFLFGARISAVYVFFSQFFFSQCVLNQLLDIKFPPSNFQTMTRTRFSFNWKQKPCHNLFYFEKK